MVIDKVSGANQIDSVQSVKRTAPTRKTAATPDQISVSSEAKELADAFYLSKVAEETPGVRSELVEQIKQKIQDPNYLSRATIEATADQLLSAYGL